MASAARLITVVVGVLITIGVEGANPQIPRRNSGSRPRVDCGGDVGFSAVGTKQVHNTGLVSYRTTLYDTGVGFVKDSGEVNIYCDGLYIVAFAGYGSSSNTKVVLKVRSVGNNDWSPIASVGGPASGGGSNQVFLKLQDGDQAAVWLASGTLAPDNDVPTTSFSAFKLTKN